jgi:hypothetical protein
MIVHNETIILVTVGLICLLSALVVYWQVFGKKGMLKTGEKPDYDFAQIEASLKKILSQTHTTIQTVSSASAAAGSTDASTAAAASDVAALKKELDERVKIIEELRAQVAAAKSDDGSADMLAKIKTLEGKLAEYEIIEDDIADLSHFKEENSRLKKEIEAIKRGGPELVDQFAAAVGGAEAASSDTVVAGAAATESAATVKVESAAAAATPPPAAEGSTKIKDVAAAKKAEASLEDIVAKAQETVKDAPSTVVAEPPGNPGETIEFGPDGTETKTPVSAPVGEKAPAPAAAEAPSPTNIFAEFAGDSEENKDPLAELGEIDTNRMLEELKDLNMDVGAGAEALEEAPDIDKMAHEAQNLGKK